MVFLAFVPVMDEYPVLKAVKRVSGYVLFARISILGAQKIVEHQIGVLQRDLNHSSYLMIKFFIGCI